MSWQPLGAGVEANSITIPLQPDSTTRAPTDVGGLGIAFPYDGENGPSDLSWIEPNHGTNFAKFYVVGVFRVTVTATYTNSSTEAYLGIAISGGAPYGDQDAGVRLAVTTGPTTVTFSYDITTVPRDTGWTFGGYEYLGGFYLGFVHATLYEAGTLNVTAAEVTVERLSQTWVPVGPKSTEHADIAYGAVTNDMPPGAVGSYLSQPPATPAVDAELYASNGFNSWVKKPGRYTVRWEVNYTNTSPAARLWFRLDRMIEDDFYTDYLDSSGTPQVAVLQTVANAPNFFGDLHENITPDTILDAPGTLTLSASVLSVDYSPMGWLPLGASGFMFTDTQGPDAEGFTYPESVLSDWTIVPNHADVTQLRWWYAEVVDGSDVTIGTPFTLAPPEDYVLGNGVGFSPGGFLDEPVVGRTFVSFLEATTSAGVAVYRSTEVTLT